MANWHSQQKDKIFDLQKELESYCQSDVDILVKSCLIFRELFMMISISDDYPKGIDPFINSLTMPSACHDVYRKLFMLENSIALIPDFGYQNHESTSVKAILWLKYISKKFNITIQHSRNGGEKRIENYKLDGWHEFHEQHMNFMGVYFLYVQNAIMKLHSMHVKMNP